MIYQLFSLVLSALFLLFMFWSLWYVVIPLLAVAVLLMALWRLKTHVKAEVHKRKARRQPIKANDVIDVDFKEV
ncbi:MAG: hypothetical protein ACI4OR_00325 [Alphaproteobacteria bacterium]